MSGTHSGESSFPVETIRHSAAHILAQAMQILFKGEVVELGVGPDVKNGFFYDFRLPRQLTEKDLPRLEKFMRAIIQRNEAFIKEELTETELRELLHDQPLKLDLLNAIVSGQLDDNGAAIGEVEAPTLTVFRNGRFVDLCAGPHVDTTRDVPPDAFKLLSISQSHWRGDMDQPMQRVSGTAWANKAELVEHLAWLEEVRRRDHRRLGSALKLFAIYETAPGMAMWLPRGQRLLNNLIAYWRAVHESRGYEEISTPLMAKRELFETSGHWDMYGDDMFTVDVDGEEWALKPMNCPGTMVVFNLEQRSYRELPLRLSDADTLHRNESSGALHGLLRVREFKQDDAHIFCTEDQIQEEIAGIFELADRFYEIFGLSYKIRIGTRPEKFVGDLELWDRAESILDKIARDRISDGEEVLFEEGGGAFYGPKIDIIMTDALGREWQMGTMQLDFNLPRRFDCKYTDADGELQHPVVIHRVVYGSLERFVGILIEHTEGAFPLWVSPEQVSIVPVRPEHVSYAQEIARQFREAGLHTVVVDRDGSLRSKLGRAHEMRPPMVAVVGNDEVANNTMAVRPRGFENLGSFKVEDVLNELQAAVGAREIDMSGVAARLSS